MTYDAVVIGGGASGMFAAGRAAERGLRVLLLERNESPGKKLSITGNGRCNLTNTDERDEFIANFGRNGKFLYRALTEFSNRDLVGFFYGLGVRTKEEEGGRIFPASDSSDSVVHALKRYMRRHEVKVRLDCRAERIMVDPASDAVAGVKVRDHEEILKTDRVILATGGLSYPATGSTGDGYSMAKELGHTIIPLSPAAMRRGE
jgi:predicted Rossmann fold flavoprotein